MNGSGRQETEPRGRASVYEELYRQWEQSRWSAATLDFSTDAGHWRDRLDDLQRESARWTWAMFLTGVSSIARALTATLDAAPGHWERLFVATQVADEARNQVFLDRFLREVTGQGHDAASTRAAMQPHLTWGFTQIFDELERATGALRRRPHDRPLLAQTIALSHIVIEGVLAIPGEHFIQRYVESRGILPGFSQGIARIARDESRHVSFGVALLGDLIASSGECRAAAIDMWDRVLPWTIGVFVPPNLDHAYIECFDFSLEEAYAFGLRSLEQKIERVGVDPSSLHLLALDDRTRSYEERAKRVLTLVEAGVMGDDRREPQPRPEVLEILFESTTRAVDIDVARSLGGPIEWDFSDCEPWHLVVTDDHVEAKPGRAGDAALRLEMAARDWAKIAVGRADARWALLTRRMRVQGHWQAKARLSKLFK